MRWCSIRSGLFKSTRLLFSRGDISGESVAATNEVPMIILTEFGFGGFNMVML